MLVPNSYQSANKQDILSEGAFEDGDKTKVDNTPANTISALNRRAFAGGVAFAAAGEMTVEAGANDFGTGDFTISIGRLHLHDYTPATAGELYSTHSTGNNRLQVIVQTNGDWRLTFTDGATATTNYDITPTTALPDYPVSVSLVADRDGIATLYVDGDANGAVSISAASAIDIGSGNTNSGELLTDANLSGTVSGPAIFNRALSATEAGEIHDQGLAPWLAAHPEDMWGGFPQGNDPFSSAFGVANFVSADSSGWSGDLSQPSRLQLTGGNIFRVKSGNAIFVKFSSNYEISAGLVLRSGVINDISSRQDVSVGINTITLIATADSNDCRITYLGGEVTGAAITNFEFYKLGALAHLPMTEGTGRQLKDASSNHYDATLSATGAQHLLPRERGSVRDFGVDASSAGYLIEAGDIIPENAVITGVIVDGHYEAVDSTVDQDLADRRARLNPSGSDLQVQRSDGTTHATLATITPSSLSDVDVKIVYEVI